MNNNNNGFSSFWFDENEGNRVNDVLGIEEKQGVDLIKLASLRRAISNFVVSNLLNIFRIFLYFKFLYLASTLL